MNLKGDPAALNTREARLWRFEDCEFDELRYELRHAGVTVELERKPLDVLVYLLEHAGEVVRKEELLEAVWPGVLVVDASLATAVSKLRKALGEREIVQTVSRVGYRICVPVQCSAASLEFAPARAEATGFEQAKGADNANDRSRRSTGGLARIWLGWALVGTLTALVLVAVGVRVLHRPKPIELPGAIAILPFENAGANRDLDYLSSALPDEIVNALSAARSVTIRPLSAAAKYTGSSVNLRQAGRELDAKNLITGRYLVAGDRLQIMVEVVDAPQSRILMHGTVDVPVSNLLAMQEQIAAMTRGRMADALGVKDFIAEVSPRARNEEAYELYLKSDSLNWDPEPTLQAIQLLRKAVLLDPTYAPAWGSLSLRYYYNARFGGGGPEMLKFSDAAAERELALDPDSPLPVAELTIHQTERGELVKAHAAALELLRRRPDDANNHHVLSYVLRYGGSLEEAGHECDLAVLLTTKVVWGSCSTTFMELGNYKRAMDFIRKDLSSEWSKAHAIEIHMREGKTQEALAIGSPKIPHWGSYEMLLACAAGAPEGTVRALAAKVEADDDPEVDYLFAGHLAYCGQSSAALKMLKLAVDRNYCSYPAMDKDPLFDRLRGNAEYQRIRGEAVLCHEDFIANRERSTVLGNAQIAP